MHILESAQDAGRRGLRVFEVRLDKKAPKFKGWQQSATADPREIERRFKDGGVNIGVATGDGILVLDFESLAAIALFELEFGAFPETLTVKTRGGGRHYYFRTETDYVGTQKKDGFNLDIRCKGNLVLWAGSEIAGGTYSLLTDAPIADLPESVVPYLEEWLPPAERQDVALSDSGLAYAIGQATAFLATAEPAVTGAHGDTQTYKVAAQLKNFGVPKEVALHMMLAEWNGRCSPPWSAAELKKKLDSAEAHSQGAFGSAAPEAAFEPLPQERPKGLYAVRFKDTQPVLRNSYVIKRLIYAGGMSVIYGDSWSGKTFLALDLCFAVATGQQWRGNRVRQGPVLYVAAEGGELIKNRVAALKQGVTDPDSVAFSLVPCGVDLLHKTGDVAALIELIKAESAHYGMPPALVVIDTFSRAMAGGNENSPDDMGAMVINLDRIRAETGAHLMTIHHSGKDPARGARGHSILRAATDTELEVADREVSVTKQKDGKPIKPFRFDLVSVTLGEDEDGEVVDTCVVRYPTEAERGQSVDMQVALSALRQAIADKENSVGGQQRSSAPWKAWFRYYVSNVDAPQQGKRNGVAEKRLRTLRTDAEKLQLVGKTDDDQYFIK